MKRFSVALLALTVASAPVVSAAAQDAYMQQNPAPIVRQTPQNQQVRQMQRDPIATLHPVQGVTVRTDHPRALQTVSTGATRTELRLTRGLANITVRGPAPDMLLLVDLPGGQTQLLKDGFYTFNADTDTVHVFEGEADAFVANADNPVKVKSDDQVTFNRTQARVTFSNPAMRQDILPGSNYEGQGEPGYYGYEPGYGYAAYGGPYGYGDGFYGYPYGPYDAWGSPYYGWGYPWGFGGFGLGFGFGGGFYGGGYGFRGGGFRGRR
jgi:hypothetical protein